MTLQIPSCYRLLIGLAFFLSAVVCLPASAGDQPVKQCPPATAGDQPLNQGSSTTVKFGDLDLNTDAGRRELLDRLSTAAHRMCAKETLLHSLHSEYLFYVHDSTCYSRTLAAAVDKVHHEQLSALFAAMSRPNMR
jgi:UrcA family protein